MIGFLYIVCGFVYWVFWENFRYGKNVMVGCLVLSLMSEWGVKLGSLVWYCKLVKFFFYLYGKFILEVGFSLIF